jgi:hypothetical protein
VKTGHFGFIPLPEDSLGQSVAPTSQMERCASVQLAGSGSELSLSARAVGPRPADVGEDHSRTTVDSATLAFAISELPLSPILSELFGTPTQLSSLSQGKTRGFFESASSTPRTSFSREKARESLNHAKDESLRLLLRQHS